MQLFHYLKEIGIPNKKIELKGHVSHLFLEHHILTLWDAINYIHCLPYERTTNRDNYLQVQPWLRNSLSP